MSTGFCPLFASLSINMRNSLILAILTIATSGALPSPGLGQSVSYSSYTVVQDQELRLNVHASGNKATCAAAPLPAVKVIEPPKSGTLTVRRAELTTDKLAGCPRVKLPAQAVFYRSRSDFIGKDMVVYGVTNAAGGAEVFNITIEVTKGPELIERPGDKI